MPNEFVNFINTYGYFGIFLLLYLQEIGIPIPLPNELLMLFSGYLVFNHILSFPLVLIDVIIADFLGAATLYFIFYFFGRYLLTHKPRWLPISTQKIERVGVKINGGSWIVIFILRITPFIRGYTSVVSGLVHLSWKKYFPIAFITSCIVCSTYISLGNLFGRSWNRIAMEITQYKSQAAGIALLIIILVIGIKFYKHQKTKPEDKETEL